MMKPLLKTSWLLILLSLCLFNFIDCKAEEELLLSSDQPGIIGSNITFTLRVKNPKQSSYDVAWVEQVWGRRGREFQGVADSSNSFTTNWTLPFTYDFIPGTYSTIATVSYKILFWVDTVGSVVTYFNLSKDFKGILLINQTPTSKKKPTYVSTMNETQMNVSLHDPYNYLSSATNVTWSWYKDSTFIANTSTPDLKFNFTKEGVTNVNVTLNALHTNASNPNATYYIGGSFSANITVEVPIVNFTVIGEAWFPQGRLLNLKLRCAGSTPMKYCYSFILGSYNITGDEKCDDRALETNDCEFLIMRYFDEPGLRSLVIILENDVSRVINKTLVMPYKVNKKQPLSIIIVPITCSLIALVMIIFGIAYFWENRSRFNVEVADFDFGQNEDLPYMTFMERLKDAITTTGSSRQRFYHPPDDEPILSSRRASQFS